MLTPFAQMCTYLNCDQVYNCSYNTDSGLRVNDVVTGYYPRNLIYNVTFELVFLHLTFVTVYASSPLLSWEQNAEEHFRGESR